MANLKLGRRQFATWLAGAGGVAVVGCSSDDSDGGGGGGDSRTAVQLPELTSVVLTTERVVTPKKPRSPKPDKRKPIVQADLDSLLKDGFGEYSWGPGEKVMPRMPDGTSTPPAAGANAKPWVRFVHITDIHVADDESPSRLAGFDGPPPIDGADRPQAAYMGRVLNAAVRTINAYNKKTPVDFVLLGGDTVDSSLTNEVEWAVNTLSGAAEVRCDSGEIVDPVPGDNNDPKDPYMALGLDVPWYMCVGNHDVEIMGINKISVSNSQRAVGDNSISGTRDWGQPGAPVVKGEIPPDAQREPVGRKGLLGAYAADDDGHGAKNLKTDKGSYAFDVDGTPLRFVVYDTALEGGGADGIVRKSDMKAFLKPTLDKAQADGKLVVLASHHGLKSIGDGSHGGAKDDATLSDDLKAFFLGYDNIIASITGHTHENVVSWVGDTQGGFWEVQTSSLVEFPSWMRIVEISDQDNGYVMIRLVGLEYATDDDPVAEQARHLAICDHTSGWGAGDPGAAEDRNVELYVPITKASA